MQKKILSLGLIVFFLISVNAYETNLQAFQIDEPVPTEKIIWHWLILEWTYTGPATGDTSWQECDFESPDKNYGIFNLPHDISGMGNLIPYEIDGWVFGPTTSTPVCEEASGQIECTATTTLFFKKAFVSSGNYVFPLEIRGKCGVTEVEPVNSPFVPSTFIVGGGGKFGGSTGGTHAEEKETKNLKIKFTEPSLYPIDLNYDYNVSVDLSLKNVVPDINSVTRWGKVFESGTSKNAVLNVFAHDPQEKNIIEIAWVYPSDCQKAGSSKQGQGTPDMNSEMEITCNHKGIKPVVVYATNEDGKVNFTGFLSYFSDNNDETELELKQNVLVDLPDNKGIGHAFLCLNADCRQSDSSAKLFFVAKDIGNGLSPYRLGGGTGILDYQLDDTEKTSVLNASTPFVSVQNPVCSQPLNDGITATGLYEGEDFGLWFFNVRRQCEVGNHELNVSFNGSHSDSSSFSHSEDFNFVVLDLNVNVIGMVKTFLDSYDTAGGTPFGMVFGEDRKADLNIIVDNYSPDYTDITGLSLVYSSPEEEDCNIESSTSSNPDNSQWKIDSHFECSKDHVTYYFNPLTSLSNLAAFERPVYYELWITPSTDKLKMNSLDLENFTGGMWDPANNVYCIEKVSPKTCSQFDVYDSGSGNNGKENEPGTAAFILPSGQITITKGDLLHFPVTITNVYSKDLQATAVIVITDQQGNEVAVIEPIQVELSNQGLVPAFESQVFQTLLYDTDYLKENTLYTVTSTAFWRPANGFKELDNKPFNNTKITYFYVLGNSSLVENLPETNYFSVALALIFVLFILAKK